MLVVIIDIKSVRWLKSGTDKCMVSLPLSKVVRQYVVPYHEDAHVLLPNRLECLWEYRELLQRGLGRSPGRKRISVLFKHHRMYLVKMFQI